MPENNKENNIGPEGIVRRIDDLGRLCIPKEMRSAIQIADRGHVSVDVIGDTIVIKKHIPEGRYATSIKCMIEALVDQDNLSDEMKSSIRDRLNSVIDDIKQA